MTLELRLNSGWLNLQGKARPGGEVRLRRFDLAIHSMGMHGGLFKKRLTKSQLCQKNVNLEVLCVTC